MNVLATMGPIARSILDRRADERGLTITPLGYAKPRPAVPGPPSTAFADQALAA